MSVLPRGQSNELLNALERHLIDERLAQAAVDDDFVAWQLAVQWRRLVPMPVPETDVEREARDLLGGRYISRKLMYQLFGLVDDSPAVQRANRSKLRTFVDGLKKSGSFAQEVVLIDFAHASLTKLRKILPKRVFSPSCWEEKEKWPEECVLGGPMLFTQETILETESMKNPGEMLFHHECFPHPCELAYYNLAVHFLGLDLPLDDGLVRCCTHGNKHLAICFMRQRTGRIPMMKADLGHLEIWGTNTTREVFVRGCESFN